MNRRPVWLRRHPGEAGVFEASDGIRSGFLAAIPVNGGDWWEGPFRRDPERAFTDLDAELALRLWLGERADAGAVRCTPVESRRPAA